MIEVCQRHHRRAGDHDLTELRLPHLNDAGERQTHAGMVEQRDQTYAAWRQATAAHQRDQALENAAQRQVELAQANINNATEAFKLSQIVLDYTILRAPNKKSARLYSASRNSRSAASNSTVRCAAERFCSAAASWRFCTSRAASSIATCWR